MHTLLAVDDGLANANYNWADIFFLAAVVLAVLATFAAFPSTRPDQPPRVIARWLYVLLCLAVGCVAFGLFLL